jgi:hypothetical protein
MKSKLVLVTGLVALTFGIPSQGFAIGHNSAGSEVGVCANDGVVSNRGGTFMPEASETVSCICNDHHYGVPPYTVNVPSDIDGCGWDPSTPGGKKAICSQYPNHMYTHNHGSGNHDGYANTTCHPAS